MPDSPESKLSEAELFRLVVEAAPNAMVLINGLGTITLVNGQAERIFGYAREEMIGHPVEMLIREDLRERHVQDRDNYMKDPQARAMGAGRELRALRKDGTEFPVEIGLNPIPLPGSHSVLAAVVDISERRRAEAEREELVRLAVEAAPNAMIMANANGEIVLVNQQTERMFGYSREELIGRPVEVLINEGLRPRHVEYRDAYMQRPEARAMGANRELKGVRKDGSEIPVEIGLNPIPTDNGTLVLAAVVDISERRRAEAEQEELEARVRHSQKLESLGVLAGGIAHDFNNLLAAIMGNAELAIAELPAGSPAEPFLRRVFSATKRAAELTRQMLAYSGRGKFEVRTVDLSSAVKEMGDLLRVALSKKAHLRFSFGRDLPFVEADLAQLNQVVMNLITNANEALGDADGDIHVRTGVIEADGTYLAACISDPDIQPGRYVFLEVADTGSGMDEETRSRIFDPFFTTKFTGRGLGLSAVVGITRGHKGAIHVESEPGRGTVMRVLFPAGQGTVTANDASEARDQESGGTVLIADDEDLVRGVTRAQFERLGFDVVEARDGTEAVESFTAAPEKFSLAVLDLTMPGIDGDEVARRILAARADIPIILASGYSPQDLTQRLKEYPGITLLPKPFSLSELREAVERALK